MTDAHDDAVAALTRALGATPPESIAALPPAVLHDLADAIDSARRGQLDELDRALDDALRLVPRMLRGPVKRVLT